MSLAEDPAHRCMLHHEASGTTHVMPYHINHWNLCSVHGWQGRCHSPCKLAQIQPVHGTGKPCYDVRRPPHPALVPSVTAELLVRADLAAQGSPALRTVWKNKILRVRSFVHDGFWVRAHFVLSQGMWASLRGIPFFVHLHRNASCADITAACEAETHIPHADCLVQHICDAYSSQGESGWEEYFEPINRVPLRDIYRRWREENIVEMSCDAAWYFNAGIMGGDPMVSIYAETWEQASLYRARNAQLVAKWVRVRPDILRMANQEWGRITRGGTVIGVHLRGTDKFISPKVPPEQYFELIDAFLTAHQESSPRGHAHEPSRGRRAHSHKDQPPMIFLATDDAQYQQQMLTRYGNARITQLFDGKILRAQANNAIWADQSSSSVPHAKGLQVLLDTLLLSKCDFLLKPSSAVSEFAIYFNPRLANNSYDFNLHGQPLPRWLPQNKQTGSMLASPLSSLNS
mmetsp:Transcript_27876/g.63983  ORF Transcript_27876/g.63983 Transcript_27876/m.63983 type:complete len:459 (-) Transcript_27876:1468-2844(-)